MNKGDSRYIIGLLFFWPVTGWGHVLSPAYYPLGHVPIQLTAEWWPFFLLIAVAIAVEAFVLWTWTRRLGPLSSLWRATVLYAVARAAEIGLLFAMQSIPLFQNAGWRSSSEDFVALVLFLAGGLLLAIPVGLLLYRRADLKTSLVVLAVCTASLAGYLSALGCGLMLIMSRGY